MCFIWGCPWRQSGNCSWCRILWPVSWPWHSSLSCCWAAISFWAQYQGAGLEKHPGGQGEGIAAPRAHPSILFPFRQVIYLPPPLSTCSLLAYWGKQDTRACWEVLLAHPVYSIGWVRRKGCNSQTFCGHGTLLSQCPLLPFIMQDLVGSKMAVPERAGKKRPSGTFCGAPVSTVWQPLSKGKEVEASGPIRKEEELGSLGLLFLVPCLVLCAQEGGEGSQSCSDCSQKQAHKTRSPCGFLSAAAPLLKFLTVSVVKDKVGFVLQSSVSKKKIEMMQMQWADAGHPSSVRHSPSPNLPLQAITSVRLMAGLALV